MNVLVTGGAGYIGSHTSVILQAAGHNVIIVDNLSNSDLSALDNIQSITGIKPKFYLFDLCEEDKVKKIFKENRIDAVIHFAGLKAVGESVGKPLLYYSNNLISTLNLLHCMETAGCFRIVFSSSATVYGGINESPMREEYIRSTTNPYGATKRQIEEILEDLAIGDDRWAISILRYFNPVGAHPSGLIGENPRGIPNNLVPFIAKVALGELEILNVYGNDYNTPDGTGIRDYIHVMDLADGHLKALDYILEHSGTSVFNLGTGKGYSVYEVLREFERVINRPIPYRITDRRPGDIDVSYADASKAEKQLLWKAERNLHQMLADHWNYLNQI